MAHAVVNAGIFVEVNSSDKVAMARIVFGGLQNGPRFAVKTASFLEGRALDEATLKAALAVRFFAHLYFCAVPSIVCKLTVLFFSTNRS